MRIRVDFDAHGLRLTGVEATAAPSAAGGPPTDAPGFVVQACDGEGRVLHTEPVAATAVVPGDVAGPALLPPAGTFEAVLPWPPQARWIVVARRDAGGGAATAVARFGLSGAVTAAG